MHFPKRTSEYQNLNELSGDWPLVYGPFPSRRLKNNIGINLLGSAEKACSYNCPYCELGLTEIRMRDLKGKEGFPSLQEIEYAMREKMGAMISGGKTIEHISIVGNGEPTLYPDFDEAMDVILKVRADIVPTARIVVFTNGTMLDNRKVVAGLNKADERMVKMDAGNEEMLKRINSPLVRVNLTRLIAGTRKLKDVIVQTMFVQGAIDNTLTHEVDDWMECVGLIVPKIVHIYSLDRVPASSGLTKVSEDRLDVIGAQLERRTRIKAVIFPSSETPAAIR